MNWGFHGGAPEEIPGPFFIPDAIGVVSGLPECDLNNYLKA